MSPNSSVNFIRVLLVGVVIFALTGCGGGKGSVQDDTDDTIAE